MNNLKSACDYFESMPDNLEKDLLLIADSQFDENIKVTISY